LPFVATNVLHNFELDKYGRGNFVIVRMAIIVVLGRGDLSRRRRGCSRGDRVRRRPERSI
jgi:hypothetical protein